MSSRVLAISVNYNGGEWIVAAVRSLLEQDYRPDVVVVDNDSTDGSVENLRHACPEIQIVETGKNLGSVAGYNYALRYSGYDYIFLLNPDANAPPQCVSTLTRFMDTHPDIAVLGPAIVEESDPSIVQAFAPRNDFWGFPFDEWEGRPVSALPDRDLVDAGYPCAAAAMYRADVFKLLNGMDEKFFMFTEEPDFSWRARLLGYRSVVTPRVRVRHVGGGSASVGMKNGIYTTSARRVYLRERNCLMMSLKCFSTLSLLIYLPVQFASLAVEAVVLALTGHREVAIAYYKAVRDAFAKIDQLMADRRHIQRSRIVPERDIWRALTPGYAKLTMLFRRGIPNFAAWKKS